MEARSLGVWVLTSKDGLMQNRYRLYRLGWLIAIVLIVVVGGIWLRDSPVFAIKHVNVEGATGQDADRLRSALTDAAMDMTALHVRKDELETVAEPYPTVASISVSRKLPNTLTIKIQSREPVAAIVVGETRQAVAADGVLLRGVKTGSVPIVRLEGLPTGDRITGGKALAAIRVLGAVPKPLRPKIRELTFTEHGIVVTLIEGPEIRFGDSSRPNAKWLAAARVLADKSSEGTGYVDVGLPERPAAGGLEDPSTQRDPRAGNETELPESAADQATTSPPVTDAAQGAVDTDSE